MKKKARRKFVIIAKVDSSNFVKYRSDNIDNLLIFLKKKYSDLRFANIYSNQGADQNKLLYTWGKIKGLQKGY